MDPAQRHGTKFTLAGNRDDNGNAWIINLSRFRRLPSAVKAIFGRPMLEIWKDRNEKCPAE